MISTLATFPPFLHKDIIEYLSTSFLPMAICKCAILIGPDIMMLDSSLLQLSPVTPDQQNQVSGSVSDYLLH